MAAFHLQIVTMDGNVFDGQVQSVSCRTIHGDLAIMARHMNYCTAVGMGTAHVIMEDGTERTAACIGGMLTVMNGECRLILLPGNGAMRSIWSVQSVQRHGRRKR